MKHLQLIQISSFDIYFLKILHFLKTLMSLDLSILEGKVLYFFILGLS